MGKSGRAQVVRPRDGGNTWISPATVFDLPGRDDGTDLLGCLDDGTVIAAVGSYAWAGKRSTKKEADTFRIGNDGLFRSPKWIRPNRLQGLVTTLPAHRVSSLQSIVP